MAANEELLGRLHDKLASRLLDRLESGEELSPSELSVIVKFLKDNHIEALPSEGTKLRDLADKLPEFTDEEQLRVKH